MNTIVTITILYNIHIFSYCKNIEKMKADKSNFRSCRSRCPEGPTKTARILGGRLPNPQINIVYLGKLSYFTNLNLAAIKGDDFPKKNHDFQGSHVERRARLPRNMNHDGAYRSLDRSSSFQWWFFMGKPQENHRKMEVYPLIMVV